MNLLTVHWVFYALAFVCLFAAASASWMSSGARLVTPALALGLALQVLSAVARWIITGHPPIFGTFENTVAASWSVGALVLWMMVSDEEHRGTLLIRLLLGWVVVILGYGLFFQKTPYPLTISERSVMIDIHVVFAWASFALLLAASTAGIVRVMGASEDDARTDEMVLRGLGLGFAMFTAMIVVGSVYSYILFADWYRWEIVGASAMAAWLGYGASLHAYLMFGWRGRKLAWCAIGMLPLLLMVFWSWSVFAGTYHYFDLTAIKAS